MDDREALPDAPSWHPSKPLTVVIAEADVVELAEKLTENGWWRVDGLRSVNDIQIDAWAEQFWNADPVRSRPHPTEGKAWVRLFFPGYTLACDVPVNTARDIAAGLTGESDIIVPVLFNCEPDDEDDLPDKVVVYFTAEHQP